MQQASWLLSVNIFSIVFLVGLQFFYYHRKNKRLIKILKDQEEKINLMGKENFKTSEEFKAKRKSYFEKISLAFAGNGGGDIIQHIQHTTTNFQKSEDLFLANIKSLEAITETTNEVQKCTMRSKQTVSDLEKTTCALQQVTDDHQMIVKKLKDVQEKCKKINDIAFQAHLLSFNASIEAAQAGEHGKGFSVVAEDIGEMANMSKKASNDITKTVNQSLELMLKTSSNVEESIQRSLVSTDKVINDIQSVDIHMKEVVETVSSVNDHAQDATVQIKMMGSNARTELENLTKILSDVIGVVTEKNVVDLSPDDCVDELELYNVIDVRGHDEWNDDLGHISSAIHMPLSENFEQRVAGLDKDKKYLFVCRSGGRSARAARIAQSLGFSDVNNLSGGMLNWKKSGFSSVWDSKIAS
jgi:methyl-accepting chemotaxis protein/rhodanese-related sulfurtransferase